METPEHTPVPWRVGWHTGEIFNSDGVAVALVKFQRVGFGLDADKAIPTNEQKANARFIIQACNSYDDMLAALEEWAEIFESFNGPCERTDGAHCTMIPVLPCRACSAREKTIKARAAIAKAKGERE